jgi:catechol 2,3-dioxygenase-like lactoylglutathione lyase family enzyme
MIKPHNTNNEFALSGINHVALVCSDTARTVDFYSNTLGMPLIKALDLPGGVGQHFYRASHDESEAQVAAELHPGGYVRSFYFHDPDGITLEFACWVKEFGDADIGAEPRTGADRRPRVPAGR